MSQLLALTIYAILLMPGFLQVLSWFTVGYYYFFSSQVRRSIVYGEQPRNRLDLYIPKDINRPCPVVAFVTGGAWIIGNFPQGTIGDMVSDASQGISYVCNNIASYGGDPNRIYLVGQSAGAHIAACALIEQAVKESSGQFISWSVTQIKAYFGLSGGQTFADVLQQAGAQAKLQLYEGKTHTDIFIQDPLRGGRDPLVEDVLSIIHVDDEITQEKIALAPAPRRLVFEWQLQLARRISPF
uniref:Carboxylesterase type B domain-containing protein n=1 Tax=Oryza barthii TaxID=65489 RepID=A0A0D3ERQ7_9ORYZ